MEIFTNKNNCSGCTACATVCPFRAIKMMKDEEGFLYPQVDSELCVECGKCLAVCPWHGETKDKNYVKDVCKVRTKDEEVLKSSSSGGVFYSLANRVIDEKGCVYGARFDESYRVIHDRCETKGELFRFQGSKYVQSDMNVQLLNIEKDLLEGKLVMFTGTPCQCAGVREYMEVKKILSNRLILVDCICHGTPSPLVWKDYLHMLQQKYGTNIQSISFRNKEKGWKKSSFKVQLEDGCFTELYTKNKYCILFSDNLSLRPSCYNCKFANKERVSDITLADYWKIEKKEPLLQDDKGLSMILINTEKGSAYMKQLTPDIIIKKGNLDNCAQPQLEAPCRMPLKREAFWKEYHELGAEVSINKYGRYTFSKKMIREIIVPITKRLGIFSFALSVFNKIK